MRQDKYRRQATVGKPASFLQARRAYEAHFGREIPAGVSYQDATNEIVEALGLDAAIAFITGQSSDPKISVGFEKPLASN